MNGASHYDILQVMPTARPEVIVAAWRAQMKLLHPDHTPGYGDIVRQMNEAKRVLTDPDLRSAYDAELVKRRGGALEGKYRILEEIAEGSLGITYKAEHTALPGNLVCVKHAKCVEPEYKAIWDREVSAMWDLRHHAIPAIRDYLKLSDGSMAIVMSYIPGPTLHDLVKVNGPIIPEDVAWIAERILNALQYLHFRGVIHGDLKPHNVIIDEEKHEASLVDFGIAAVKPTGSTRALGATPMFMPPEIEKGFPPLPQADFYSLGATMIYALTGDLKAVAHRQVPNTVPDPLCEFMKRLLHWQALQRPDWGTEDLMATFARVRQQSFGRRYSGMRPIQYVRAS